MVDFSRKGEKSKPKQGLLSEERKTQSFNLHFGAVCGAAPLQRCGFAANQAYCNCRCAFAQGDVKTGLFSLLCGAVNPVSIWSACAQHEILYIAWSTNKRIVIEVYMIVPLYLSIRNLQ